MITHSSISVLEECPYRFYLEYVKKIKCVKPKTVLGSAVHVLLERHIKKEEVPFPKYVAAAIAQKSMILLQAKALAAAVIDKIDLSVYSSEKIIKRTYRGVAFGGKVDLLEEKDNEIVGIADFKITSFGPLTFLSSTQAAFYAWLMNKPIKLKYIVIPAPTIRQKKTESKAEYYTRLYEKTKNGITTIDKKFSRNMQHKIIEWVDGTISQLSHLKTYGFWRNYTACSGYKFGNCELAAICQSQSPETLIDANNFYYGITHQELDLDEDILEDIPVIENLNKKLDDQSIDNCRSLISSNNLLLLDSNDKLIALMVALGYKEKVLSKVFKRVTKNMIKKYNTYLDTIEELLTHRAVKKGSAMDIELSAKALEIIREYNASAKMYNLVFYPETPQAINKLKRSGLVHNWTIVHRMIEKSSFLKGYATNFSVSLHWLIQNNNWKKVSSGRYLD